MKYEILPWLILFLPLLAAGCITLFTLRYRTVSALLSIGAIVIGFILSVVFINANGWQPSARSESVCRNWLGTIGSLHVDFGLKLDALSMMMLLVVTGVGGAIHIYSFGYMHEDRGFSRYFRVHESVHLLDARHRAGEQFHRALHFLGTGRCLQLSPHRFLV